MDTHERSEGGKPDRPPKPSYRFGGNLPPALEPLQHKRQWLAWDYRWLVKKEKWDKPPLSAHTGTTASINKPADLGTFAEAAATAERLGLAGVGFVLMPGDNLAGIDLDNCVTDASSYLPLAAEVLAYSETYAEFSPSGAGIRMLALGKPAAALKYDAAGVEIYATGRYLTITGRQIDGTPDEIREAPRTIAKLRDAVGAARGERSKANGRAKPNGHGEHAGGDFWAKVNAAALANLGAWVPPLHPTARKQSNGAWRVSSADLGRNLEEDVSYHTSGVSDFGEERGLSPIDAVQRFGHARDAAEAAIWLCQRLNIEPASLGWRGREAPRGAHAGTNGQAPPQPDDQDWPDPAPLPAGLLPVAPFDYDTMLPEQVVGRVRDIADRMQCPAEFVAVPMMVGLGSVIGRKIGIRPKKADDWTLPANQWGDVVAPPGKLKSPAHNEALSPLRALEAQAREDFRAAKAAYKAAVKAAVAAGKDADSIEEPVQRRYITGNITAEALGEILKQTPNGVLNLRDELAALLRFLDDFAQGTARELYLQGWSGVTGYNFDRIGRGLDNFIGAVCISMFGTTQPSIISRYIAEFRVGGRGNDGLLQRFGMGVWPDPPPNWTYVDRQPNTLQRKMAAAVFKKLSDMTVKSVGAKQDKIDDRDVGIPYLRFAQDAQAAFVQWYTALQRRLEKSEDWSDDLLREHISKYGGLVPGLALICHLADWDPKAGCAGPVSLEALHKALAWVTYLETHARRIYASGDVSVVEAANAIIAKVKSGHLLKGGFSSRDVWRPQWSRLTHRPTVSAALELLVDYDWARAATVETNGRKATVYTPNPKVLA